MVPILVELFLSLKKLQEQKELTNHREDARAFTATFINNVPKLHIKMLCDLFQLDERTMIDNTNIVFSSDVDGENQFKIFEKERLIINKIPIKAMIKNRILKSDLKIKRCSEALPT